MAEPTNNPINPYEQQGASRPASTGQQQDGNSFQQQTDPTPERTQPAPQQQTRPMGSQAPQMPQQTQPYGAAHAPASGAPVSPDAPRPAHGQTPAALASSKQKKSVGGVKTFLLAFFGAVLGFTVAFGATALIPGAGGSGTTIGGSGGSTFAVSGEDVTLPEAVAQKTLPSVVNINVYTANSSMGYGMMGQRTGSDGGYTETSLGSGVILTSDGYILTNYHVIEGADKLEVVGNGGEYEATLVGTDESSDLAVIKIDATDLTAIEVGSSDALVQGQWVMAVGSPFGLEQSVSTGIVSATSRSVMAGSDSSDSRSGGQSAIYTNMIQTDAAINPGNSGGALVDKDGKLVGINTLIASSSGTSSGVGFAIPSDYAVNIAQQIIDGKTPSHAQLGVSMVTIDSSAAARYNLPVDKGAYIAQIASGTGAEKAGLQVGDIITKIDGKQISSSSDVMLQVRSHKPGDTVQVTYNRDGQENTVEVTLGSDS